MVVMMNLQTVQELHLAVMMQMDVIMMKQLMLKQDIVNILHL